MPKKTVKSQECKQSYSGNKANADAATTTQVAQSTKRRKKEARESICQLPNAEILAKISRVHVSVKFVGDSRFPVSYDDFERYTNVHHLAKDELRAKSNVSRSESSITHYAKKMYTAFYTIPDSRRKVPLFYINVNPDCPRALRKKIFMHCTDGSNSCSPPTSDDTEMAYDESIFFAGPPTAEEEEEDNFKFPVTLNEFKRYTECYDVVDELIKRRQLNDDHFREMQPNDALREQVLKNYYRAFYTQPSIRSKVKLHLKPCPGQMKRRLLQNGRCVRQAAHASKRAGESLSGAQHKRHKTMAATDINSQEVSQQNFLDLSTAADDESSPITFTEFKKNTNVYALALEMLNLKKANLFNETRVLKKAMRLYTLFYKEPKYRNLYPLKKLEIAPDCTPDMRSRILGECEGEGSYLAKELRNEEPPVVQQTQKSPATHSKLLPVIINPEDEAHFPTTFEEFQDFTNIRDIAEEKVREKQLETGKTYCVTECAHKLYTIFYMNSKCRKMKPLRKLRLRGGVCTKQDRDRILQKYERPTSAPERPTSAPERPTSAPERPTSAPERPTSAPERPTSAPEQPTSAPERPTSAPERPTSAPERPTNAPERPTSAPERPTSAPERPTSAPERPTSAPERPTSAPERPTSAPEQPTSAPERPTSAPERPTSAPERPTSAPERPTSAPERPIPIDCGDEDESVFFEDNGNAHWEAYTFPVDLNEFKKFSNCYTVVDALMSRRAHDDHNMPEYVALRERVLTNFYRAFYTQPEIRAKYQLQLKACPAHVKAKMMQEAVPKDTSAPTCSVVADLSARQGTIVASLGQTCQQKASNESLHQPPSTTVNKTKKISPNLNDEKKLPVTFAEFDTYTNVREIAAAKLSGKPSAANVTLYARKLYITYFMRPECRKMLPLWSVHIRPNCPSHIRSLIFMKLNLDALTSKDGSSRMAANEPPTEAVEPIPQDVGDKSTSAASSGPRMSPNSTCIPDVNDVCPITCEGDPKEADERSKGACNYFLIDKQQALSDSFLLRYIRAKLPNYPDPEAILKRLKMEVLHTESTLTTTTTTPTMVLSVEDIFQRLSGTIKSPQATSTTTPYRSGGVDEEHAKSVEERGSGEKGEDETEADAAIESAEKIDVDDDEKEKQADAISAKNQQKAPSQSSLERATQLANVQIDHLISDSRSAYFLSKVLRNSYGLKQSILLTVLEMSADEFCKYARLFIVDDAETVHINDAATLQRCYSCVIAEPHVWPKNLFIPLADLIAYLRTRGVALRSADLALVSPKVLHWDDLAACTDFDECVRLDYTRRHAGEKPKSDDDIWLHRKEYHKRCCALEEWMWRAPRITDPALIALVNVAKAEAEIIRCRESAESEENPLLVDVIKARQKQREKQAALTAVSTAAEPMETLMTNSPDEAVVDNTAPPELNEADPAPLPPPVQSADPVTSITEELLTLSDDEVEIDAEIVHAASASSMCGHDQLEQTKSKVTSTQRSTVTTRQRSDLASDELLATNEVECRSPTHSVRVHATLSFRQDMSQCGPQQDDESKMITERVDALPVVLQVDVCSNESETPEPRIDTLLSPSIFPSSSDTSQRHSGVLGAASADAELDASDHFVEMQGTQQQIEALNHEFLVVEDPLVGDAFDNTTLVGVVFEQDTLAESRNDQSELGAQKCDSDLNVGVECARAGSALGAVNPLPNQVNAIKLEPKSLHNCKFIWNDETEEFDCRRVCESENVIVIDDSEPLESSTHSTPPDNEFISNMLLSGSSNCSLGGNLGERLLSFIDDEASGSNIPPPTTRTPTPPPTTTRTPTTQPTKATSPKNALFNIINLARECAPGPVKTKPKRAGDLVPQLAHEFRPLPLRVVTGCRAAAESTKEPQAQCSTTKAPASAAAAIEVAATANSNSECDRNERTASSFSVSRLLNTDNTLFNSTALHQAVDQQQQLAIGSAAVAATLPPSNNMSDINSNSNSSSGASSLSTPAQVNVETLFYRRLLRLNYFEALKPAHIIAHKLQSNDIGGRYMEALISSGRRSLVYASNIGALLPHLTAAELRDVQFVLSNLQEFEYSIFAGKAIETEGDLRRRVLFFLIDTAPWFAHCRLVYDSELRDFGRCERVNVRTDATLHRRPHCALSAALKPEILAQIAALKAKTVNRS